MKTLSSPGGHVHGVLVVDKPRGMTSHDVVCHVRRAFKTRRVGHAGTLDPMATGVLVLLLGEATKLSGALTTQSKAYRTTIQFGVGTDSLDADGRVTSRREHPNGISTADLERALGAERTRKLQVPPQVSAVKVNGQRSYALARRGEEVDLEPRDVRVHRLELEALESTQATFFVDVSKGYYVRSLARDLALALGTVGHLTSLRRMKSGMFELGGASSLPLPGPLPLMGLAEVAKTALPWTSVADAEGALRASQGKLLGPEHLEDLPDGAVGPIALLHRNRLLGLVVLDEKTGLFRMLRGIHDPGDGTSLEAPPSPTA